MARNGGGISRVCGMAMASAARPAPRLLCSRKPRNVQLVNLEGGWWGGGHVGRWVGVRYGTRILDGLGQPGDLIQLYIYRTSELQLRIE